MEHTRQKTCRRTSWQGRGLAGAEQGEGNGWVDGDRKRKKRKYEYYW